MRGAGEPVWEHDFPPGSDMMGEIRRGPLPGLRMESELFARLGSYDRAASEDDSDGIESNRALDPAHVNSLVDAFAKEGVGRFETKHRISASISSVAAKGLTTKYPALNNAGKEPTVYIKSDDFDERPTLDAGQHRRAAPRS
ncbi:hypothetical protein Plec18167_007673 [Paecilomyces lecythidis]|uniref:Uncharacterized protein n=1 Tax=Paecilomyces lecythidis TaxID=3004212 RepID=A0ABR3X286_9EURO